MHYTWYAYAYDISYLLKVHPSWSVASAQNIVVNLKYILYNDTNQHVSTGLAFSQVPNEITAIC